MSNDVVRVRPETQTQTRQQVPNFVGVSGATTGATGICMHVVVIPAGGAATPHTHQGYETAIYILKGRVDTRYGDNLSQSMICEEGDFLFIGPNIPHQPVNLSETEDAMAVVARNDPNEQEHVIIYEPDAG
jgi:uncharacterized RmlC-like cupin family protein